MKKNIFLLLTLILLPFNFPSIISQNMPFNTYGVSLSILPLCFVIVSYLFESIKQRKRYRIDIICITTGILILGIYSIIVGAVLSNSLGETAFYNTFSFFLYPLFSWITIITFANELKKLKFSTFSKIMNYYSILFIFLCFFQLLVLMNNNLKVIYDGFNFLGFFRDSEYIIKENRICGFLMEPSNVGEIICAILIPYQCYNAIKNKSLFSTTLSMLLIFCTIMSKSSTCYIALIVLFLTYILKTFFSFQKKKNVGVATCLILASIIIFIANFSTIQHYIDKIFNLSDMSTSYRYSIVYNDINIYSNHFFGVGNGNQGFFYKEIAYLFEDSNSLEIKNALDFSNGVVGGGPFWGSLISGYGIIGILFMIFFNFIIFYRLSKTENNMFKTLFLYSYIIYNILGLVATNINLNIAFSFAFSFLFINKKDFVGEYTS